METQTSDRDGNQSPHCTAGQRFVPSSGMSSSLKDRLKKCGRYHPATPPYNTPRTSLGKSPLTDLPNTPLSSLLQTPTSKDPRSDSSSKKSYRRHLPQPRNILCERSNLGETSHPGETQGQESADKLLPCASEKGDNFSKHLLAMHDCDEKDWTSFQASSVHDEHQVEPQNAAIISNSSETVVPDMRPSLKSGDHKPASATHTSSSSDCADASADDLLKLKKNLAEQMAGRKETLRKLNMVKTYRTKNDLGELGALIGKWRSVCQQAILDLHQMATEPRSSLTQLVQQLGVDAGMLHYNDVEECFDVG